MTGSSDDTRFLIGSMPIRSFVHFSGIDSTNDWGKRYFRRFSLQTEKENRRLPLLVWADTQSFARGRLDHRWWSPEGCLTFSLLARWTMFGLTRAQSPLLSLRVARATLSAIRGILATSRSGTEAVIQPPNDILAGGKKVAGILIESPSPQYVVIGIGLNVNNRSSDFVVSDQNYSGYLPISLYELTGRHWCCYTLMETIVRELFCP